jgi:hypothetical protein
MNPINQLMPLSQHRVGELCRLGQGPETCRFLLIGPKGACCARGSAFEVVILERLPTMSAKGDNCSGPPDFVPKDFAPN